MNIVYINHYAGSPDLGMEFRPYHLGQEWIKSGHNITLLAASYSHVRTKQPKLIENKKTTENINGLEYIWYPTPSYNGNGLSRVKNIFSFLRQIWLDSHNLVKKYRPDVVIASSTYPMDIWIAKRLAKKANAKLVFELHDLWPLSPIELGGMSPKHPFIQLCQLAENAAYKHADVVISMLPKVQEHTKAHGLDLNKLHIIPNGVVIKDWINQLTPLNRSLEKLIVTEKNKGHKIVCYSGAHGRPNALEKLLKTASLLHDKPITFLLVGTGLEKDNLIKESQSLGTNNVIFFDPIPKTQIPTLLNKIDIAYIGLQKQSLFRFGISPNKLIDYMMAGKPILCAIDAGNDPVSDVNCGITVKSGKPEEIARALLKLSELSTDELNQMGQKGKIYALENHAYSVLADNFIKAIINHE
ncbi:MULTISPECIES: glycosyltransferase family 4 protein [Photorhabdus]|uniref:glycosyltransferase family 4 protein n=2 Tax=Morganellaceae TaxID=1903414 RepID=UPI000DCAFC4E|nr:MULTISPECIES: glycosyltransferase family 4 protein [Photorhabdus]AXG45033.1 glycosyltransferase WbuB [Photorhabdus laumondii subsp. laumondii]NDL15779.1 glycosyltransferase [Photorhabdus laumondii subsp. laumondii]NDL47544.1 glycosyltransferase [Photorhabdus laumondii subsp. laumondii]NDL53456.1 glycosyltransferase [Photorhabdus laumondii subsp. laumondii]RAW87087.1 glycosyltransferase WbuB [Photorhabdus sp. S5P8-50]